MAPIRNIVYDHRMTLRDQKRSCLETTWKERVPTHEVDQEKPGGAGGRGRTRRPRSKADHAYAFIRQRVLDGQRAPRPANASSSNIWRERWTSVSSPSAKAIRRLEAEGYVTYTRNVGATVTSIDLDRYPETVEALAVLEGVAIGLAAPHITAKDIKAARALNEQIRGYIDAMDPLKFTATNHRFHEILYQRCPNRHLLTMVTKEWELIETTRRSAFEFIPERAIGSVAEHERVVATDRVGKVVGRDRGIRQKPSAQDREVAAATHR